MEENKKENNKRLYECKKNGKEKIQGGGKMKSTKKGHRRE
jgi:hypothetical protein